MTLKMMAPLPKLATNGRRAIQRNTGLLSSLPRGSHRQQRFSTLTATATPTRTPSVPVKAGYRRNHSGASLVCVPQYHLSHPTTAPTIPSTSITRNLRRPRQLQFSSSSSSSFLDKLKQKAEDTAKSVAQQASQSVQKTATKATQTAQKAVSETIESTQKAAQKAVSETLESTQKAAHKAKDHAIETVSQKASEAAHGVSQATKKQLSRAASSVRQSAPIENLQKSKQVLASGLETTQKAATSGAESFAKSSRQIKESSQQLKENLTSTSAKVIRWFWWWSLAAIFVYGVASTLPMAIIKYTVEQKKKAFEERTASATATAKSETAQGEDSPEADPSVR